MSRQRSSGDLLADRRYAYAAACLAEGDPAGAAEMAEQALALAPDYAPAWFLLGEARDALLRAGDPAQAAPAREAFARALALEPEDALGARMRLASLGEGPADAAIGPAYIRALFDGYAPRFERHLVGDLGYRGPEMIRDALQAAAPDVRFGTALDLGCGTGLMGAALAGRVGHLTGIDLSPAMLALARRRGCYDRLLEGELLGILAGEPEAGADLVTAADVFIYCGDLGPVLAAIARVLRRDGLASFTVQSPEDDETDTSVRLGPDGRYAHGDGHLRQAIAAAGLAIVSAEPAGIRRQNGRAVPGRLLVLRRPG